MASKQLSLSSRSRLGSDVTEPKHATVEERKLKRKLSNRESARRSRARKLQLLEDLKGQVSQLQSDNYEIVQEINVVTQDYKEIEAANNVLRAQVMELTDRLQSLNSVLRAMQEANALDVDIPEVPNHLPKMQPTTSSVNMSQG